MLIARLTDANIIAHAINAKMCVFAYYNLEHVITPAQIVVSQLLHNV